MSQKNSAGQPGKSRGLLLSGAHRHGSKPLIASLHLKFDVLALVKALKVELLETAAVEENLLPISSADKSESAVANNSFDCPLHSHLDILKRALFRRPWAKATYGMRSAGPLPFPVA